METELTTGLPLGRSSLIRDASAARVLGIALLLGIAVDLLFYGKVVGISFPLFVGLLLLALFGLGRIEAVGPARRNLWLVVPLAYLAAMVAVRANGWLMVLNIAFTLVLLGLLVAHYGRGRVAALPLVGYPIVLLWVAVATLVRAGLLLGQGLNLEPIRRQGGRGIGSFLRGLLLAAPIVLVFAVLLASADIVFNRWVDYLFNLEFLPDLVELSWRAVIVLGAAWVVAGGLAFALWRSGAADAADEGHAETEAPVEQGGRRASRGTGLVEAIDVAVEQTVGTDRSRASGFLIEAATIMLAVDLLFLGFVWIQFAYLFGGETNITFEGFTYAQYARRGFFELVAVAVLTLGLVLGLKTITGRETVVQHRVFNLLASLMVLLVLVILASAFKRLLLYEDVFGYSQLRLYSHVFMVWLGLVLVWFAATLWVRPTRFAIGAFLCAIGFVVTLNAMNPDAVIVRRNLARYEETGDLDVSYLGTLSDDAVPALVSSLSIVSGESAEELRGVLRSRWERSQKSQERRSQDSLEGRKAWPSYHLGRDRAYDTLADSFADQDGGGAGASAETLSRPAPRARRDGS